MDLTVLGYGAIAAGYERNTHGGVEIIKGISNLMKLGCSMRNQTISPPHPSPLPFMHFHVMIIHVYTSVAYVYKLLSTFL